MGAGVLLGQIAYTLLEYHNLVTPHGTCPTVGIAGLALGGGYGYLTRTFGLTTDNVIELEMVDASGTHRIVNKDTDPELLWAMRGAGSGNFGVVTKLKLKAYAPPALIIGGTKVYTLDQFPAVFLQWQQFVKDTYHLRDVNTKLSINKGEIILEIFDIQLTSRNKDESMDRINEMLDRFPTTASVNTTSVLESMYADFLFRTSHPDDLGITDPPEFLNVTRNMFTQRHFHAKSFFASRVLAWDDIWTLYWVLEETIKGVENIYVEMYAFGGAIDDMSAETDTSFNHRTGTLYLVQAFYNGKADADEYQVRNSRNWLRKFYSTSKDVLQHTECYQNYADDELEDYLPRYYGANLERLIQLKESLDPDNFFNHPQSIPVALE